MTGTFEILGADAQVISGLNRPAVVNGDVGDAARHPLGQRAAGRGLRAPDQPPV
jgi:hypothetical protein